MTMLFFVITIAKNTTVNLTARSLNNIRPDQIWSHLLLFHLIFTAYKFSYLLSL